VVAAVVSTSLLAGPAVAESSGSTTPEDTVADPDVAATEVAAAETSVVPAGPGSSARLTERPAGTTDASLGYLEYLPADYDDDGLSPLLVFVHGFESSGAGTTGALLFLLVTGIPDLIASDMWPAERPFVVLAPQHAYPQEESHYDPCYGVELGGSCAMTIQHELGHPENGSICVTPAEIHDFLSYAIARYDVDPQRVYLTGLSCGATGAWEYVGENGGSQIAAMVPIAGEGRPAWGAAMCSLGEVAIWAFHGDADNLVAPAGSIDTITNLTACPPPRSDAELSVYPGVDHDAWTRTYDLSAGHDIYDWLLGFTVSQPAVVESTGEVISEGTIVESTASTTTDSAETSAAASPATVAEPSGPSTSEGRSVGGTPR
jgi:dienelactone hydrolase